MLCGVILSGCLGVTDSNHPSYTHNCTIEEESNFWMVNDLEIVHDDTRRCPVGQIDPYDDVLIGAWVEDASGDDFWDRAYLEARDQNNGDLEDAWAVLSARNAWLGG